MSQSRSPRSIAARDRQLQRESQKRRRELDRQAKEMAKLSALEQARLEVETFENSLDVLLSIHKEPREQWNWIAIASDLKYPAPQLETKFELQARYQALANYPNKAHQHDAAFEAARNADNQAFQTALQEHEVAVSQVESLRSLAGRILDGEGLAFLEAFAEFNPVAEFSSAGSLRQFAVERRDLIDCVFKVDFEGTIPKEVKSLTAGGKLTIKAMPKARRHELFQDYVSACTLRMAGEVFAMLPIETVIVTALADVVGDPPDKPKEIPILSVVFDRAGLDKISFEADSAADAIDQFAHRCNFKITRKSGGFQPVIPFTTVDVVTSAGKRPGFDRLLALIKELGDEIRPAAIVAGATVERNGGD